MVNILAFGAAIPSSSTGVAVFKINFVQSCCRFGRSADDGSFFTTGGRLGWVVNDI